jgi:hypothetical protein
MFAPYLSSITYTLGYQFAVYRGTHVCDMIITYSLDIEFQYFGWVDK